jgi:hypothetical protein
MEEAARNLGLEVFLEAQKRHPKDSFTWGRLRIKRNSKVFKTKMELLARIASGVENVKDTMIDEEGKIANYSKHSLSILGPRPTPPVSAPLTAPNAVPPPKAAAVTAPQVAAPKVAAKVKKEKKKVFRTK